MRIFREIITGNGQADGRPCGDRFIGHTFSAILEKVDTNWSRFSIYLWHFFLFSQRRYSCTSITCPASSANPMSGANDRVDEHDVGEHAAEIGHGCHDDWEDVDRCGIWWGCGLSHGGAGLPVPGALA